MSSKKFVIGTRGSQLALTQANFVKDLLEGTTSHQFEIKAVQTRGDQDISKPLWQMEGQNFFTKELDIALTKEEVDLVVHSHKDLGTVRPDGLMIAAITKRELPQDVLLIKKDTVENLNNLDEFIVGTSSPRRMVNCNNYLSGLIPNTHTSMIKCKSLRGNINTRIQKLNNGEYHAIILALAGLERLAKNPQYSEELETTLSNLNFMVLPLSIFPPAASQGALAIEIKKNREDELQDILKILNDPQTQEEISKERRAFKNYGGGCHLPVGIYTKKIDNFFFNIHSGFLDGEKIKKSFLENLPRDIHNFDKVFIGLPDKNIVETDFVYDQIISKIPHDNHDRTYHSHFIVTSKYCIPMLEKIRRGGTIWAAGYKTMIELAKRGYWVNGTADSLGENHLKTLIKSKALNMMMEDLDRKFLSNDQAETTLGVVIPSYTRKITRPSFEYIEDIKKTKVFYWTSLHQFQIFKEFIPGIEHATHACGLGKTLDKFKQMGINVLPFSGIEEFKDWIQKKSDL